MKHRTDFWEEESQRYIDCKKALDNNKPRVKILNKIFNYNKTKVEDIINNIYVNTTKEGIVNLNFKTKDKYVDIFIGSMISPDFNGKSVLISPIIYKDGKNLYDEDLEQYIKHKDYYIINIGIELDSYIYKINPLKYEYMINFIPNYIAFNRNNKTSINL